MDKTKVCIMGIYIGKLPDYFSVWLKSCEKNSTIDFVVISDQKIENHPKNVKIINMTLNQLKEKISKVVGFEVALQTPFKLCDYKPAYGYVFHALFDGYDYWGHCDFDLIFGDLRSFFSKYKMDKYDKFLPLGHLSLYRNTKENNMRFMEDIPGFSNYKKIFTDDRNFLFDELGIIKIYNKTSSKFFDKIIFADIKPNIKRYTMCTNLKYYPNIYEEFNKRYKKVNFNKQVFIWDDNKIYQYYIDCNRVQKREYIYIHIQKRKWCLKSEYSNRMVISNNEVFKAENTNIEKIIKKYNKYSLVVEKTEDLRNFIKHCWSYLKRKILKIEKEKIIVEK